MMNKAFQVLLVMVVVWGFGLLLLLLLRLFIWLAGCCCFWFSTGSHYVALAVLECAM